MADVFAWTSTEYNSYPPYVNLTGNRLVMRNPPTFGRHSNGEVGMIEGVTVALDLPDEALRALSAVILRTIKAWEECNNG
jgi:hypothetical protein